MLELLFCEQCGTTFFGGSRLPLGLNEGYELLVTEPELEGLPDRMPARFLWQRTYRHYAVFWPSGESDLHEDAMAFHQRKRGDTERPHGRLQNNAGWSRARSSLPPVRSASERMVMACRGTSTPWTMLLRNRGSSR